jgi:DNA mismatch repair protein MutH
MVGLLRDYGPWGLLTLALLVIRALDQRATTLLEKVVTVALASKTSADNAAAALKDVESTTEAIVTAVETLAREQEGEFRDLRHAVANYAAVTQAVHERMSAPNQGSRR